VVDQSSDVTGVCMRKEQSLRQHASGRKDRNFQTGAPRVFDGRQDIRVKRRDQRSVAVTLLPDLALQRFETWRFSIPIHQPENI
jgi:hypothetical protein